MELAVSALAIALLLALMRVRRVRTHALRYGAAKTAASLVFIGVGVRALDLGVPAHRALFLGLALSLVGDVLLVPKDRRGFFLSGLAAFLCAHLAYCAAFFLHGLEREPAGVAAIVLIVVGAPIVRWLWPHVKASMRGPVIAYLVTLSAMVALAAGAVAHGASAVLVVGAALFYASDLFVARERFVKKDDINGAVGLPLYYAGQLLLIAGLTRGAA